MINSPRITVEYIEHVVPLMVVLCARSLTAAQLYMEAYYRDVVHRATKKEELATDLREKLDAAREKVTQAKDATTQNLEHALKAEQEVKELFDKLSWPSALPYEIAKDHRLEVVRTSYERALKYIRESAPSSILPTNPKESASAFWSRLNNKCVQAPASDIHASPESEESKKKGVGSKEGLTTAVEAVSTVSVKAPRKKLRKHVASKKFRLLGSLLAYSDSSPEDCNVVASHSPVEMADCDVFFS
ncbi:hypothetical protein ACFE04_012839 [Oxalis oulophora]